MSNKAARALDRLREQPRVPGARGRARAHPHARLRAARRRPGPAAPRGHGHPGPGVPGTSRSSGCSPRCRRSSRRRSRRRPPTRRSSARSTRSCHARTPHRLGPGDAPDTLFWLLVVIGLTVMAVADACSTPDIAAPTCFMLSALALVIWLTLALVVSIDYPFSGIIRVTDAPCASSWSSRSVDEPAEHGHDADPHDDPRQHVVVGGRHRKPARPGRRRCRRCAGRPPCVDREVVARALRRSCRPARSVSHDRVGHPRHALVGAQVVEQRRRAGSERSTAKPGTGSSGGLARR